MPDICNSLRQLSNISFSCINEVPEKKTAPLKPKITIPEVNLNHLTSNDPEVRNKAIAVIGNAIRTIGFFAVVDTELKNEAITKGYAASKHFFAQSHAIKEEIDAVKTLKNGGQRGWIDGEIAQNAPKKDWKEFYHVGCEKLPEGSQDFFAANAWPTLPETEFKKPINDLYEHLREKALVIGEALFDAVEPLLPEAKASMQDSLKLTGNILMRLIHYKKNPPNGEPWAFPHKDTGFFTILPRADSKGLEVQVGEEWIPVDVSENSYIVNLADHFENWTNGECKAAVHRVVAPNNSPSAERDSIVFFVHGQWNTNYKPLPGSIARTGGTSLYPELNQQQLLFARLIELGVENDFIQSTVIEQGVVRKLAEFGRASDKLLEFEKRHLAQGIKV